MLRTQALMNGMNTCGITVRTFALSEHGAALTGPSWMRLDGGLPADAEWSKVALALLHELVSVWRPDLVVFETLMSRRAATAMPEDFAGRLIYDAHNVEAELAAQLVQEVPDPVSRLLVARTQRAEREFCTAVDRVWACSESDAASFRALGAMVDVLPNVVEVPARLQPGPRLPGRILFAGAFNYYPNQLAVRELLVILPQLPYRADLLLAGAQAPPSLVRPRVKIMGASPSLVPAFRSSEVLALPLHKGGGTRFKVLEAAAHGLPVISTSKGVEGLGLGSPTHYLRAENIPDFVEGLTRLHEDSGLRERLAGAAFEYVAEHGSQLTLVRTVRDFLATWFPGACADG